MEVTHNKETQQFIMQVEDETAFVNYQIRNDVMHLVHAQVPYALRGKGHGKPLVIGSFELLTAEGYKAKAVCSYVKLIAMRSEKWKNIIG